MSRSSQDRLANDNTAVGRLTQVADSLNGTILRTYDGLDSVLSETTPQGAVSYTYDAAGRRVTMSVLGQLAASYSYDNANRLTQISQGIAAVSMSYDNANRRTSLTLPNSVLLAYGYDAASLLTSETWTSGANTLGNLTYTYDNTGRRAQVGGSFARVNLPAALGSATYNAANQLTQRGAAALTYDLDGNLTNDGVSSYAWDARNQLAGISGGVSATFQYDAIGRRTQNASGARVLYDGVNAVSEIAGQTVTANMLTGLGVDEVFSRTDANGVSSFVTDGLGSTLGLTDATGTVKTQYTYEPFGKTTVTGASSGSSYQYTGRENDGTGLYYYRARYYNPAFGRFIAEDPLEFGGGDISLYAYASNSPTNYIDPSGTQEALAIGCLAGPPGCIAGGIVDLGILGGIVIIGGATVIHFNPNNPPQIWPDPLNPPSDWMPHPKGK